MVVGDLVRLAEAAQRQPRAFSPRQSADSAMTSGVLIGPGATALTRTPRVEISRRQRPGEADDGGLGGAVMHKLDAADLAELRGDVDDHALASARACRAAPPIVR